MCLGETQYNHLTVEEAIHVSYMSSTVLYMRLQYFYWTREHSYDYSASSGEVQEHTLYCASTQHIDWNWWYLAHL
ncbi:ribosomal dna transcription factor rrn3 [Moniliophthora roreri]|nr:ribosomal dna transcription factor rrn3 [Moniliophthora roreri]